MLKYLHNFLFNRRLITIEFRKKRDTEVSGDVFCGDRAVLRYHSCHTCPQRLRFVWSRAGRRSEIQKFSVFTSHVTRYMIDV